MKAALTLLLGIGSGIAIGFLVRFAAKKNVEDDFSRHPFSEPECECKCSSCENRDTCLSHKMGANCYVDDDTDITEF